MTRRWLAREVGELQRVPGGIRAAVTAVAAVPAGELGGWLTGEPPAAQGIDDALPNLPRVDVPEHLTRAYTLQATVLAPDAVRIVLAPASQLDTVADARWLGIVTAPAGESTVDVHESEEDIVLTGQDVVLRIGRRPFTLTLTDRAGGHTVLRTAQDLRLATGLPLCPPALLTDGGASLHLALGPDEEITGFGEQFSRLVKNGQRLTLRCTDALGTGTGTAYKPVPVWNSSRGYTALLNTGATITADIEHAHPGALGLDIADEVVDLHVITGPDPKRRLSTYTGLTGRADVPPAWAFGLWLGRCRYHSDTEMLDVARAAREHDVPLDVLHCDPDWLVTDRLNCDFLWNTKRFGPRKRFVDALREQGTRLSVWELPYLDPASPRYAAAEESGCLVRDTHGAIAHVRGTPSPDDRPRALVDLTADPGRSWWQRMHEEFLDDGVAVFKTDFAEGVPDDVVLADGTPPAHAHNLYPLRYNAAVSEVIRERTGRTGLVWGRSGWAGSQRYPAQWGGDAESSVAGMRATVRAGLSFAMSAPGLWSHDVGGFYGPGLTPGLYARWTQLGALSPLMRAHGLSAREPWAFGERVLRIARDWIRLRYALLPYLWQVAHESARHGWPMMRPLALEFPDDPAASAVDGQFLLGHDLLVVPVFDDGDEPVRRRCYLPAGRWHELRTGAEFDGGRWHTVDVPLERMPVLVRDGAVLPTVEVAGARNTDDLLSRPWLLRPYGTPPATLRLTGFDGTPVDVGIEATAIRSNGTQPIAATPAPWEQFPVTEPKT